MGYIIVFVLGIVAATVGFGGLAQIADNGVAKIQQVTKESAK